MEVRSATAPEQVGQLDTEALRDRFLIQGLLAGPDLRLVYSHEDRLILGGVPPRPSCSGSAGSSATSAPACSNWPRPERSARASR